MKSKIIRIFIVIFIISGTVLQYGCKKEEKVKKKYMVKYIVSVSGDLTDMTEVTYNNVKVFVPSNQTEWSFFQLKEEGDLEQLDAKVIDDNTNTVSVTVSITYNDILLCSEHKSSYGLAHAFCLGTLP
ncbi:MAG: hypothetical protein WCP69_11795 [Bacteroidota bacterium]